MKKTTKTNPLEFFRKAAETRQKKFQNGGAAQNFIKNSSNPLGTYTGKYIAGTKIPLTALKKTVTVNNAKGKTVYDPKKGTTTVYNSKGKTITERDGIKIVQNKKGTTKTYPSGQKQIYNKKGLTAIFNDGSGTKATFNKQGRTDIYKDGTKRISNTKGETDYDKNGKKITPAKTPAKTSVKAPVSSGPTVSQTWVAKTGTSWSEAKKQGLTDGSAKSNLALLEKLNAGTYDKKPAEKIITPTPTPNPAIITAPTEAKLKPTGTPSGGSGIGAIEREEEMYKRGGSVRKKMMFKKSKRK